MGGGWGFFGFLPFSGVGGEGGFLEHVRVTAGVFGRIFGMGRGAVGERAKEAPFVLLAFFPQFDSTFWPNLGAIHVARPVVVL